MITRGTPCSTIHPEPISLMTTRLSPLSSLLSATLVLLSLLAVNLSANTIRGTVTNAETGSPIEGASVQVEGTSLRATTDRFGQYSIGGVETGEQFLIVRAPQFQLDRIPMMVEGDLRMDSQLQYGEVIEMEEFQVNPSSTGSAAALAKQRAAQGRVEVVASDEFQNLPDRTVADALRRLPGVTVENSAGRSDRFVTIRGMFSDFNSVNVNGVPVMVSDFGGASRSVPLDVVSSANVESIEVAKTLLPGDWADSIGGSINIRTRSGFDQAERYLRAEASIGYVEFTDTYEGDFPFDDVLYDFQAEFADQLSEEWAFAISANAGQTPNLFKSIDNGDWVFIDDTADGFDDFEGDDAFLPEIGQLQESYDIVETKGVSARIDFRPNENWLTALELNYSERETNQGSWRQFLRYDPTFGGEFLVSGPQTTENNTAEVFTVDDRAFFTVRDFFEVQESFTAKLSSTVYQGDWTFEGSLGFNYGNFEGDGERDLRADFQTGFQLNDYDQTVDGPQNPSFLPVNPASDFFVDEIRRGTRETEDIGFVFRLDASRDLELFDVPGMVKGGLGFKTNDRDLNDRRFRYNTTADVDWTPERLIVSRPGGDEQIFGSIVADFTTDEAYGGRDFGFFLDPNRIRAAQDALERAGIEDGGDPNLYLGRDADLDARADLVNSYEITEYVYAAYLMHQVDFDKWTIIYGLRGEFTDVEANSFGGDFFLEETDPEVVANPELFVPNNPIESSNDYVNVLPHLHVRYDWNEQWIFRASINQSLVRPSFTQLNPSEDIEVGGGEDLRPDVGTNVTRGDTTLDPVLSTNIEFSVDYYFDPYLRVAASVFYKNMEDNVYRLSRRANENDPDYYVPLGFAPEEVEVDEFLNAEGAEVYGFELGFDASLAFLADALEGLSLSGNYTFTESEIDGIQRFDRERGELITESGETELFGQVPHSINASVIYERFGFFARLAWNWTDDYLDFGGLNEFRELDIFIDERQSWDLTLAYTFPYNVELFFEIDNLFENEVGAYAGVEERMVYREEESRVFIIGLEWRN